MKYHIIFERKIVNGFSGSLVLMPGFYNNSYMWDMSPTKKMAVICLLSMAAEDGCVDVGELFEIDEKRFVRTSGCSAKDLKSAVNSLSDLGLITLKVIKNIETKEKPTAKNRVNSVIARYCELWKEKYKTNPTITKKDAGYIATTFSKYLEEKSISMVEKFFELDDPWFVKNAHSISCMINSIPKITAELNGVKTTQSNKTFQQQKTNNNSELFQDFSNAN